MKHPGKEFYETWADRNIVAPDRRTILTWKAANLANLVLRTLKTQPIHTACEVGGAEGIVLSTVGRLVGAQIMHNYELSTTFCEAGRRLFPEVEFINTEFDAQGNVYDLIVLSDIVEHLENESAFLAAVSRRCQFVVLKMPIETCVMESNFVYKMRGRVKPDYLNYGPNHFNGHLRGYTLGQTRSLIAESFTLLDAVESDVLFFHGGPKQRLVKRWVGTKGAIWLFGGALFALAKSRNTQIE